MGITIIGVTDTKLIESDMALMENVEVKFNIVEEKSFAVINLGPFAYSSDLSSSTFSSTLTVSTDLTPVCASLFNTMLAGIDFNNFDTHSLIRNRLFKVWLHHRGVVNALIVEKAYTLILKAYTLILKKKGLLFRRFRKSLMSGLEAVAKFGLVLFVVLVFPAKAQAVLQDNPLEYKSDNREFLTKIILASVALAGVATVSYLLFYSPKARFSAKILGVSNLADLSTKLTTKPEFLKVPDFLSLPVTSDIVGELIRTLQFVKATQFDSSFSNPLNRFEGEELLKQVSIRMAGLLNYQNSPDFNHASMRSIERAFFIMCSKNKNFKNRCRRLEIDQALAHLVVSLARRKPQ